MLREELYFLFYGHLYADGYAKQISTVQPQYIHQTKERPFYDTTERTKNVLANISHTNMNLAQNIDSSKEAFTITRSKRKS